MGSWFYAWVEVGCEDESGGKYWIALFDAGEYLGRQAWWKIPIFGEAEALEGVF